MNHRTAIITLALVLALAVPRDGFATAVIQVTYATVDFVEIRNQEPCSSCVAFSVVLIRGIIVGSSTATTTDFSFGTNKEMAARCERLALIAMSKPGKYQFGIGSDNFNPDGGHGDCRLTLVAP